MTRLTVILLVMFVYASAAAETLQEKGLRIAEEADQYDQGYGNYSAVVKMVMRDRRGRESERIFDISTLEVAGDGDKSLIVFRKPRDINDTALLTHAHEGKDDDQWLYLPGLKRVKRISSANRSGAFVASEFAYEDLIGQEVGEYNYNWLRQEPCPGASELICNVSERFPTNRKSGYTRHVAWIDDINYRIFKVDYFDRKNAHLKTLELAEYAKYQDRYWRPGRMLMVNHQSGKSTLLVWRDYTFGLALDERNFSRRALERAR